MDVPRSRCARRGVRAGGRTGAAAKHRGDAGGNGLGYLLRADEVNVRVDATRRHDHPLARDNLRVRAHHQLRVHAGHQRRVARFANRSDVAVFDADVGLDDAPVIDEQRIRDQQVRRLVRPGLRRLPHAVAQHLATAEFDLVSVYGQIAFHLDEQLRVGQAHTVAGRGAVHLGIRPPLDG